MKKLFCAAGIAAAAVFAPAMANETEAFCVEFASANGWDTEPCACVGEVAEANPDVKAVILALKTPEDVEAMDQSVKDEIAACFPES